MPVETMTTKERLVQYLKYQGISQAAFEKSVGLSNGYVNNVKESIKKKTLEKISKVYPYLNVIWLNSEVGEMLMPNNMSEKAIRYYDIEGTAGKIEMFDPGNGTSFKEIVIPGFGDCDIALNVWGDSMEPVLCSGCIAICKEVSKETIDYGYMYFIVTQQNNRMFKFVKKSEIASKVLCTSANDFYDPFEINRDDILKLYIVKGHIERSAV